MFSAVRQPSVLLLGLLCLLVLYPLFLFMILYYYSVLQLYILALNCVFIYSAASM